MTHICLKPNEAFSGDLFACACGQEWIAGAIDCEGYDYLHWSPTEKEF